MRVLLPLPLVLFAAACPIGTSAGAFGPSGTSVDLKTVSKPAPDRTLTGSTTGELLAADSTSIIVLTPVGELVRVSFRAITGGRIKRGARVGAGNPAPMDLARLKLLSRYPQGISPDLLDRLLREYRRDALRLVEPQW